MNVLRLIGAVLLWAAVYTLVPQFDHLIIDGIIPIAIAAGCLWIMFRPSHRKPETGGKRAETGNPMGQP